MSFGPEIDVNTVLKEETVYGGEPVGYVIELENGLTLYHAGDTCAFGDMQLIRELYAPDIAMLPIGDFYTMGLKGAALSVHLLGVKQVIPMHSEPWFRAHL